MQSAGDPRRRSLQRRRIDLTSDASQGPGHLQMSPATPSDGSTVRQAEAGLPPRPWRRCTMNLIRHFLKYFDIGLPADLHDAASWARPGASDTEVRRAAARCVRFGSVCGTCAATMTSDCTEAVISPVAVAWSRAAVVVRAGIIPAIGSN